MENVLLIVMSLTVGVLFGGFLAWLILRIKDPGGGSPGNGRRRIRAGYPHRASSGKGRAIEASNGFF